jgi:hypothetical protein
MTTLDTTRLCAGGSLPPPGANGERVAAGEPEECPACEAAGGSCDFHRGWAAGWDAFAAVVAGQVAQRQAKGDAS